jgi:hypothetical protein
MSAHTIPMPDEIDAVIFDIIAAEAARVLDDTSLDDLWSSVALDSDGQFRGYGFGYTPAEVLAVAWITARWPECDAVPRVVPEGWTFENYPPGEEPAFRRTTHRDGDSVTSSGDSRALTDVVQIPRHKHGIGTRGSETED